MTSSAGPDDIALIVAEGPRLDAASAPAFRRSAEPTFEARPRRVLLDLSLVQFMDSTGLGVLVGLMKLMAKDGAFAVAGAQPAVKRLFEITRMDRVMSLYGDVEAARAGLGR